MAERGRAGGWEHLAQWENGQIDLDRTLSTLPCSDRDAAELVAACWPEMIFYEPGRSRQAGTWYLWDGKCQRPDRSKQIDRLVNSWTRMADTCFRQCRKQHNIETAARMQGQTQDAITTEADKTWQKTWKESKAWAYAHGLRMSAGAGRLREALSGVVGVNTSDWPHQPLMLNTASCVVSLDPPTTGWEWRPHDPALRMTYCLDVPWVPVGEAGPLAGCPQFAGLLWHATGRDEDVFWYLLHALGYSLLGDNRHQVLFFLSGPTASGKSTLLEIVSTVLGELAHEAKPDLITKAALQRHGRHEASIIGKRLVTIGETNDQLRLDENQLKILTGQKGMSVDVLWKTELTRMVISALIFVANNDMPEVTHLDDGLTRRLWVVPMGETIPEWERDAAMVDRVVATEAAGVLGALVWACRRVAADGRILTMPPAAVVAKTETYKREQNTVALWFADRCFSANGSSATLRGSECLTDYRAWCSGSDTIALGQHHFYAELAKLGGVVRTGPEDQAWFAGFGITEQRGDIHKTWKGQ